MPSLRLLHLLLNQLTTLWSHSRLTADGRLGCAGETSWHAQAQSLERSALDCLTHRRMCCGRKMVLDGESVYQTLASIVVMAQSREQRCPMVRYSCDRRMLSIGLLRFQARRQHTCRVCEKEVSIASIITPPHVGGRRGRASPSLWIPELCHELAIQTYAHPYSSTSHRSSLQHVACTRTMCTHGACLLGTLVGGIALATLPTLP